MKIRKLYDPYKQQHFARVEDLLALFKDAKDWPDKYTTEEKTTIVRLAREILNKPPEPDRPF